MTDTEKSLLLVPSEENTNLLLKQDKCDKYDYLTAVVCGAIGGIVDIFLVGAPGDSVLGNWTDKQVDKVVINFAKTMGWKPRLGNEGNVKSAIGFLERQQQYKINYDQRKPGDVGDAFNIAPGTHHMMSLAHSPDIIGLFFSILNQFTSTSSFIANGQLITINTATFELQGGNFIAKLFCGITNWFVHLMSDIAGSSGSHGRGSGIVMPFYELFGFCKFGKFNTNKGVKDLSEIAMQAFNQGYDFRFGLTQAIPVVITDLTIRLIWAIRRRFQYKLSFKECIPTNKHDSLRVMLLIGNGTLCVMDGVDAGIRSGGNALLFFTHLNLVAWYRLVMLVLKEVCIRLEISLNAMDEALAAFKRINTALQEYLLELEKIDVKQFKEETERYNRLMDKLKNINDEKALNIYLLKVFEEQNINLPWEGDFNEFMGNKDNKLVFS